MIRRRSEWNSDAKVRLVHVYQFFYLKIKIM